MHGDVVEEEDDGDLEGDGVEHAALELRLVDLVNHLRRADALRLHAGDAEVLLLLRQPLCRLGPVGEGPEGDDGQDDGNDTLDGEDHAPAVQAAKGVEGEDRRGEQTAEGAGEGRHDHVER